jgi:surfactin family lipopeptide synthetase A
MTMLVHEAIVRRAADRPDAVAVVAPDATLTYGELAAASSRLACRLQSLGVGPDVIVGVLADRTAEMVVAVLGVLRAGGAYLPLDPDYPATRLAFMVEDAAVQLIVASRATPPRIPAFAGTIVTLEPVASAEAGGAEAVSSVPMLGENLAYVVYTSGSTGRPKGVLLHHHGLANLVATQIERFGLDERSRVLQLASFSFDASVSETFTTLVAGATLVLADRDALAPKRLAETLRRHRITALTIVPSSLAAVPPAHLPDLATIVVAGEACSVATVSPWTADRRVLNAYGPSETTVCATVSEALDGMRRPDLGRPLRGLSVYVLDDDGRPVAPGEVGEVHVGGVAVARGYLGRPRLTADRFRPDPFDSHPGARMYATGDLARRTTDDALEFVGRLDDQVKIRGVRIELGEVEEALAEVPGVAAAVAAVREDTPGEPRLVGYVTPGAIDVVEVRRSVAARLPHQLVPRAIVAVDVLPRTPTGKIDRAALPPPATGAAGAERSPDASSAVEARVAAIWADVLGRPVENTAADFFELGGDSLQASSVVTRVRREFGVDVGLGAFVGEPTIAGLARTVTSAPAMGDDETVPASAGLVPLSPGQARLWFLEQLAPGGASYNVPAAVVTEGALDRPALEDAVAGLADRHAILVSRVVVVGGEPRQEEMPDPVLPTAWALVGDRSEAEAAATEFARTQFDLSRGPLARVGVWAWPDGSLLCLAAHHIAVDGRSTELLLAELADRYSGRPLDGQVVGVAFRDVAAWQHARLAAGALDRSVTWWRQRLADAPDELGLPADRPSSGRPVRRGGTVVERIRPATAAAIRRAAREHGATTFSALLAGFAALVVRYGGAEDVVLGAPFSGRTRPEWEDVVGFFVNTVVLRTDCSGDPPFGSLIARVAAAVSEAWAHQDVPFERVVAALAPGRDPSRNPLFQEVFTVERAPRPGFWAGREATWVDLDLGTARFGLELTVRDEARAGFVVTLRFDAEVYEQPTAAALVADYVRILASAGADPRRPLSRLELGSAGAPICGPHPAASAHASVVELVAEVAARQPQAAAVVDGGTVTTYGALVQRAESLARRLAAMGAGPGTVVGMCAARSADAVVAWLGIMGSGAAYLPLDADYPAERLAWMVADARVGTAVVGPGLDDRLPAHLSLAPLAGDPGPGGPASPLPPPRLGDVAYVIYTSGSTGTPKGVEITHDTLARFACSYRDAHAVTAEDRATVLGPLSFDISVLELWPYLVGGASVAIAPSEVRLVPAALCAWLSSNGVTIATLVTPLCEAVLASGGVPPTVRLIHTGGDRLIARPPRDAGFTLVNNYGPTECTVAATSGPVELLGPDDAVSLLPDLGRPLPGTALYLLDRWGNPAPVGASAELYVGGDNLARGYLRRPSLTAERFGPDPFGRAGSRMYRTGDRVRLRHDGKLAFGGRADQQIKLRGHRIEPAEVEAALLAEPGVEAAAVTVVGATPAHQRLAGYVAGPHLPPADELRSRLSRVLPAFMVPTEIVRLDALPTMPSGKVDRGALPRPPARARPPRFSGSPLERAIAGVWQSVLGVEVGLDDNFFDLGGTSLLVAQVQAALEDELHVSVTIEDLFRHATVAALARRIDAGGHGGGVAPPTGRDSAPSRRSSGLRALAARRKGKRSGGVELEHDRADAGAGATEEP